MGRKTEVEAVKAQFARRIDSAEKLVKAVRRLPAAKATGQGNSLHVKHVYKVVELAFMDICAQWEDFVEDSFLRYLTGARPKTGSAPKLRLSKCSDLKHAYQVLSGKPHFNPGSEYLTWTDSSVLASRAKVFFEKGEPYATAVGKCKSELERAFKLRNRIAHSSAKCIKEFKASANHYLAPGKVKQGYRVGELLTAPQQHDFAFLPTAPAGTVRDYFAAHANMFRQLAQETIP
jgi:hypothetical protein